MTNTLALKEYAIGDIVWIATTNAFPVRLIARHDEEMWAAVELHDTELDDVLIIWEGALIDNEEDAEAAADANRGELF